MEPLGPQIEREFGRFGPAAGMGRIVEAWPRAVGAAVARNAWPARTTRDGTLVVHTADSIWAFELGQQEERIRAQLGDAAPLAVKFVPGPLAEPSPTPPESSERQLPKPDREQQARAAALTSAIEDERLRELVSRAAAASLARAASDRAV